MVEVHDPPIRVIGAPPDLIYNVLLQLLDEVRVMGRDLQALRRAMEEGR
jgi:hypothetical protein